MMGTFYISLTFYWHYVLSLTVTQGLAEEKYIVLTFFLYQNSPSRQPTGAKYLSPPSRRFGKARQASSKDDSSDSGQENNFVTDQDTMVTSRSGTTIQLPPRPSSPEENDDMIKNDGLMQKLKKVFIIDDLQFIIIVLNS